MALPTTFFIRINFDNPPPLSVNVTGNLVRQRQNTFFHFNGRIHSIAIRENMRTLQDLQETTWPNILNDIHNRLLNSEFIGGNGRLLVHTVHIFTEQHVELILRQE